MELHPLAQQFAAVADQYERGRPEYAAAVVGAVAAELGLSRGERVLDLGAGTGKLTRALVAYGLDVTALEPQDELREVLATSIGGDRVHAGVAEAVPFDDGTFAAVTAADAFHWFERSRALEEIRRVLRPGGGLALLTAAVDWRPASWGEELAGLVSEMRPEHPHFEGPPYMQSLREHPGFGEPWELGVVTYASVDAERIIDHLASMSWIAAMPDTARDRCLAQARGIVESGETPSLLPVRVRAVLVRRG